MKNIYTLLIKWVGIMMLVGVIISLVLSVVQGKGSLEVHTIGTEQGTALLIKNNKEVVLLGGGEAHEAILIEEYLKRQEIEKIDIAIWTKPTQEITGGYSELVYNIPIEKLYIYQADLMDEYSKALEESLERVGCQVKKEIGIISLGYKGIQIIPFIMEIQSRPDGMILAIEIKFKDLNYLWTPHSISNSEGFNGQKIFNKIDADIITGKDEYIQEIVGYINELELKSIFLIGEEKLAYEKMSVLEKGVKGVKVIKESEEGEIILYKAKENYEIITKRVANIKVL